MIRINLLPGARRATAGGIHMDVGAVLASVAGKVDKVVIGAGLAGFVAVSAIGFMMVTQQGRAQELGERERRAVQDSVRFAAVLRERTQAEGSREAVLRQMEIIQSIDDLRYTWPHILEEVSNALPPFTWLTQIVQTSAPPSAAMRDTETTAPRRRGAAAPVVDSAAARRAMMDAVRAPMRFRIVGNTVDIQALTRFMRDLESSPFIQNVQLTRSDLVMVDQKEVTEFQLNAESAPADTTVITVEPLSVESR
jgi:Tfp pilus assembly protein PilN